MQLRKWAILKLLGDDRNLLSSVTLETTSFIKSVDVEDFERDSEEMWSSIAHTHRILKNWIDRRKALILRQNLIESNDKNGLKAILNEYALIEGFIATPTIIPEYSSHTDTSPDLKSKEEIMEAFKKGSQKP